MNKKIGFLVASLIIVIVSGLAIATAVHMMTSNPVIFPVGTPLPSTPTLSVSGWIGQNNVTNRGIFSSEVLTIIVQYSVAQKHRSNS